MSYFNLAVFHEEGQSVDELLASYDEETEYSPYIKFSREEAINYVNKNYPNMVSMSDDEC